MAQEQLQRGLVDLQNSTKPSVGVRAVTRWRLAVFWLILVLVPVAFAELVASTVLLYRYRYLGHEENHVAKEVSSVSTIVLAVKGLDRMGISLDRGFEWPRIAKTDNREYRKQSVPHPFFMADDYYGYSAIPGTYVHEYYYRESSADEWDRFAVNVTIQPDGSRRTGVSGPAGIQRVFIFGDSFVFGSGVHDEQTFAYLLQQSLGTYDVKLFALPGYSLAQAYLRVLELGSEIREDDIVILGYADFYDSRHVVDPKRLRDVRNYYRQRDAKLTDDMKTHPRIVLSESGEIGVEYIVEDCGLNDGYCDRDSYTSGVKSATSAALINAIARSVEAPVFVLYFRGAAENPAFTMLDRSVHVIHAREDDFSYFIRDRVEQFDTHPGPYWHHAMFQRLREEIPFGQN